MGQYHTLYAFNPVNENMEIVSPHRIGVPAKLPEILYACVRAPNEKQVDFFFQSLLLSALMWHSVKGNILGKWYCWRLCVAGDNATSQDLAETFLDRPVPKTCWINEKTASTWASELTGSVPDGLVIACYDKKEFVRLLSGNISDEEGAFLSTSALIYLLAISGDYRSGSDAYPYIITDKECFIPESVVHEVVKAMKPEEGLDFIYALINHPWYRERRIVGRWGGCVVSIEEAQECTAPEWKDITAPVLAAIAHELGMNIEYLSEEKCWSPRVEEIHKNRLVLSCIPPVLCFRERIGGAPSIPTAICGDEQCIIMNRSGGVEIIAWGKT